MPNRTLSPNELLNANAAAGRGACSPAIPRRGRLRPALRLPAEDLQGAYLRRAREADAPQDAEGAQAAPASGSVRRMRRPAAGSVRRTGSPGRTPRIHGRQYETALPRMRHQDSGSTRVQVSRGDDSRQGGTACGSCPWPGETVTRCRPGPPAELGLGTVNRSAVISPAGTGA